MLYTYNRKKIQWTNVFHKIIISYITVLCLTALLTYEYGYDHGYTYGLDSLSEEQRIMILNKTDKFSEDKLKQYLLDLNVKFPHIVFAQAKLESGNFQSNIFRENNNIFGMKVAKSRVTTNVGTDNGHAKYENWRQSVLDYAFYQASFLSDLRTEDEYYNYLDKNYAEVPDYAKRVKSIANQFYK